MTTFCNIVGQFAIWMDCGLQFVCEKNKGGQEKIRRGRENRTENVQRPSPFDDVSRIIGVSAGLANSVDFLIIGYIY